MLSSDLIDRLRRRAADPDKRNDAPQPGETSHFGGAFKTVRVDIGGMLAEIGGAPGGIDGMSGTADTATPLPPPATAEDIAAAQASLGFSLPDDLAQLYTEVANGGFGPGDGLAPLEDAAAHYRDLMAEPPGEGGQTWPDHLLPINLTDPGADCYDLKSGKIVLWDVETLADGPDDETWRRSFRIVAKSLDAWLEEWLSRPPLAETQSQEMEKILLDGLKSAIADLRAKSPEERAEMGLPEEGWEEVMFGHLGIDLRNL